MDESADEGISQSRAIGEFFLSLDVCGPPDTLLNQKAQVMTEPQGDILPCPLERYKPLERTRVTHYAILV